MDCSAQSGVNALLVVIAVIIIVATTKITIIVREKFTNRSQWPFGTYPPIRYDPALVSGHETVMFPNLFHGI